MGLVFSGTSCNLEATRVKEADGADDSSSCVIAVHSAAEWSQNWQSHIQSNKLMVIDFTASWCGPCRTMEPAFKAMSSQFSDVVFLKIDVDELRKVAQQWKVEAMPTFVLVKRGQEVDRVVGANKDELKKKIQLHLTK
ncbi:thioredoxin H2-2-like [Curcuma longa]|uniref:thioredoxin H2-2-like n=1 Tax=Curcuma longa TaxID=136217 RepID=UPI003D9EF954